MKINDWTDIENYSHLLDFEVNRHIWAWEFLRRNKEYQEDWGKKEQTKIYVPPKLQGENETQWGLRVLNTTGAEPLAWEPEVFYRDKWRIALKNLLCPMDDLSQDIIEVVLVCWTDLRQS